ncbi:MAG: hypothetical protein ABSG79_26495 [Bryobacteraceae bacterium]
MAARSSLSLTTITNTEAGVAPSAMRIPISFVLRATVYDPTPNTPTAASVTASPANSPRSSVLSRRDSRRLSTTRYIVATATGWFLSISATTRRTAPDIAPASVGVRMTRTLNLPMAAP